MRGHPIVREEPRLKAAIWVKALIRRLDVDFITATVIRSGDPQAGAVYLTANDLKDGCRVYSRSYGENGRRIWAAATGDHPVPETEAADYITRQVKVDPDCWVLEIEDPHGRFDPSSLD